MAYVLGEGCLGLVLSKRPTTFATFMYFLAGAMKTIQEKEPSKEVVFWMDNHSAHKKALQIIAKRIGCAPEEAPLKFNLPGFSVLNPIEHFFSSVKQKYYFAGLT